MSKRFTDTDIWDEDWFIEMPKEYKLFYFFLKDQCNHAGIWRPNLKIFEAINEVKVDLKKAIDYFNKEKERIQVLNSGHWYMIDFFVFQYGVTFNRSNRVHESIESIYNKEDINLTSIRGLKEVKDRVKDKDKDKDKDSIVKYVYSEFYDCEIAKSENNENYIAFVKFLFGENDLRRPLNKLLRLQDQIGMEQFLKLKAVSEQSGKKIYDTCRDLENYTKKTYSSFYLTLNKWLKNVR